MTLIPESQLRNVSGISEGEICRIRDFLQGAVYCWCKNRAEESFALRDLMGGSNYYWNGTPLFPLWEKHVKRGLSDDEAVTEAAKDAGWLLKTVIHNDRRPFHTKKEGLVRIYKWTGEDGEIE